MGYKKIDVTTFDRKDMYERFMNYSNPIGTITATVNITKLIKLKKKGHKLNALLNYCILKAAYRIKEFHYYQSEDGLYYYDDINMLGIVFGKDGHLYLSTWNFFDNYLDFEKNYIKNNLEVYNTNKPILSNDTAVLSSSSFVQYPIDSVDIDMGKEITHCFFTWGKYKKHCFRYYQSISLRFHHAFFDGGHIGLFFKYLQEEIYKLPKLI